MLGVNAPLAVAAEAVERHEKPPLEADESSRGKRHRERRAPRRVGKGCQRFRGEQERGLGLLVTSLAGEPRLTVGVVARHLELVSSARMANRTMLRKGSKIQGRSPEQENAGLSGKVPGLPSLCRAVRSVHWS